MCKIGIKCVLKDVALRSQANLKNIHTPLSIVVSYLSKKIFKDYLGVTTIRG